MYKTKGTIFLLNHSVELKVDQETKKIYPGIGLYFDFSKHKFIGIDGCKGIQVYCHASITMDNQNNLEDNSFSKLTGYLGYFPIRLLYGKKENDIVNARINGVDYQLTCKCSCPKVKFKDVNDPSYKVFPYETEKDENGKIVYVKFEDQLHKNTTSFGGIHSIIKNDEPTKKEQQNLIQTTHVEYSKSFQ